MIGIATMAQDGTVVLQLRAAGDTYRGDGIVTFAPSHPEYASVLRHLGGLKPGETKPVPSWDP